MGVKSYECEGQMNIFDFIKPECSFSGHTCNKQELWKVADTLDELQCPHVCCRFCNTKNCGARCNGSEEPKPFMNEPEDPKEITDDYIRENPTCFYVFGHYLDRAAGWHKMPEELPAFDSWRLIDVVLFGKKTGTAWMEHEKWEAQYWAFRSIDDRRNAETTEVLAWKLSELENTQDLENVTLEELNKKITEKIGIKFEENPKYPGEYVAKIKGGYTLEFSFSTYMTEDGGDGKKTILLGWSNKKGEGGGSPGDSIEEAVDYFKKALRRIEEDKQKKSKMHGSEVEHE